MRSFNVFVIGPMGSDKDLMGEASTPISRHMQNIKASLENIIPKHVSNSSIFSPLDGGSSITDFVFEHIDSADLAIADITTRSPSVMYELAYFHALGTPVIVIDDGSLSGNNSIPFYLKDSNILTVPDFDIGSLIEALGERIGKFFDNKSDQNFDLNPITKFYSAPLVEVSGADAVSRGYFNNFIHPVINIHSGIISTYKRLNIKELCIIRPSNEFDIQNDIKDFRQIASSAQNKKERVEKKFNVKISGEPRGVTAYLINNVIYDYPRTIGMLSLSPRVIRLSTMINKKNRESKDRMKLRITEKLIDYFFDSIQIIIHGRESNDFRKNSYRVISMEEFNEAVTRSEA